MGAKTADALHRIAIRALVARACAKNPDTPNSSAKQAPSVSGAPNR